MPDNLKLNSLAIPANVTLSGSSTSVPISFTTTDLNYDGGYGGPSDVDYISIQLSSAVVYDVPAHAVGRMDQPGYTVNSTSIDAYLPDEKYYYSPHVFFAETPDSSNLSASNPTKNNFLDLSLDSQTSPGTYTVTSVLIQDHLGNSSVYSASDLDALGVNRTITVDAVCFCRGTGIATPGGEVAVEALRIGDQVLTFGGGLRAVRWIGRTSGIVGVGSRPVTIRSGALGHQTPTRDLRVTEGHSFLFEDVLIPIGKLSNGKSILIDDALCFIEVYHIELDVHEVVFANGAAAESYRDDGNRIGLGERSQSREAPRSMPTYAPIVTDGPLVERTRRYLNSIAREMPVSYATVSDSQAA